jgi:hypothetical protein
VYNYCTFSNFASGGRDEKIIILAERTAKKLCKGYLPIVGIIWKGQTYEQR